MHEYERLVVYISIQPNNNNNSNDICDGRLWVYISIQPNNNDNDNNNCEMSSQSVKLGMLKLDSEFLNSIKEAQKADVKLVDLMVGNNHTEDSEFKVDDQGVLQFQNRICIPDNAEMKKMILEESHISNWSNYNR